jgi:hypothetical protein
LTTITTTAPSTTGYRTAFLTELRVLILAGVPVGIVVAGLGSRVAMLLLRLTSGDPVHGVVSDDGFEIGRVTLSGTVNLAALGSTVGMIGAAAYQWVRPWLLGPRWFHVVTVALGCGAVVGSILIHADGVDFVVLEPTWLAIGCFVVLPAVFGAVIAVAVDAVEARRPPQLTSWRTWIAPALLVVILPPAIITLVFVVPVLALWVAVRDTPLLRRLATSPITRVVARTAWSAVAVLGLVALLGDISDIYARV